MYDHNENQLIMPDEFFLSFEGRLNAHNHWVIFAVQTPWGEIEQKYVERLGTLNEGK